MSRNRPITFRNINAPDFSGVADLMKGARDSLGSGADAFSGILKNRQTRLGEEDTRMLEEQRTGFRNLLNGFQSPEELAQFQQSGGMERALAGVDERIRADLVGEADQIVSRERTQATEAFAYGNTQREQADAPILAQFRSEMNGLANSGSEQALTQGYEILRGRMAESGASPQALDAMQDEARDTFKASLGDVRGEATYQRLLGGEATIRNMMKEHYATDPAERVPETVLQQQMRDTLIADGMRLSEVPVTMASALANMEGRAQAAKADQQRMIQAEGQLAASFGVQDSIFNPDTYEETSVNDVLMGVIERNFGEDEVWEGLTGSAKRKRLGELVSAVNGGITVKLPDGNDFTLEKIPPGLLEVAIQETDGYGWWSTKKSITSRLKNMLGTKPELRDQARRWHEFEKRRAVLREKGYQDPQVQAYLQNAGLETMFPPATVTEAQPEISEERPFVDRVLAGRSVDGVALRQDGPTPRAIIRDWFLKDPAGER